jgi:rhamnose transport system substrate-binding protein
MEDPMKLTRRLMMAAAMSTALLAGQAEAASVKIALVVKSLGNGFFDAANKGAGRC